MTTTNNLKSTAGAQDSVSGEPTRQFQPVRNFQSPAMPAADSVQRFLARLRRPFNRRDSEPVIAEEQLQAMSAERLNELVSPPACGPLLNELHATLSSWQADQAPASWVQLVVLPPCEENGIIETWAQDNGHPLLDAPDRLQLLDKSCVLPDFSESADGVLVIPHLEHWFLRHNNGLADVRALLAKLQTIERHCVIGCNSWAWAFLCKAVNANMMLPDGLTFQAFDAQRLHDWFSRLSADSDVVFRANQSGEPVFAGDSSADYFRPLAARSLGIPWVAWHLWRQSLRTVSPDSPYAEPKAEQQTLWVVALEEFSLPGKETANCLLVLQALLIHGPLTNAELQAVLPSDGYEAALAVLVKTGFIERKNPCFQVKAAAYPAIRSSLKTAGFPVDKL